MSLIPVVQHALAAMDGLGFRADVVVSMQATSPGLRGADVDAALAKLEDSGADSVATVLRIEHEHPYWAKRLEGDRVRPFSTETSETYLQRQELPPAYVFDGALFVRRRRLLEEWSGRDFGLGADVRGLPLSAESSLHIDDAIHLEVARVVLARRSG